MKELNLKIEGFNITILIEKEYKEDTPILNTPIQYHDIPIKRIYKKWISTRTKFPKKYHKLSTLTLMSSQSDKIVKQEPLLDSL